MIDAVRLSRATYQLAERGIEALEQIARRLNRTKASVYLLGFDAW